MAKAKKQEIETVDDGSEIESQLGKTKDLATKLFGASVTPQEVLDLYDILVSCAGEDGDPSGVIEDLTDSRDTARRIFGDNVSASVVYGIFERKFCSDDDE